MNDYRRILVHLSDSERAVHVLSCAAHIATRQNAVLGAVHAVEPIALGAFLNPETARTAAELNQHAERERIATARARADAAGQAGGIGVTFESAGGDPGETMSARSRAADLLVVGQPVDGDPAGPSRSFVSNLLISAACPIVFVPHIEPAPSCGARVLVAWSATRESARALRDALPLLQRASAVEVLSFGRAAPGAGDPLDGVAAYLAAHGVAARCALEPMRELTFGERMLNPTVVDASIGELLLSHATDIDADLIVMGGYGHARAFEHALGGVTRTMLGSMTVPVLMSH